eukprot:NODE_329_length_10886_cov_0.296653.p2 type:complete len:439 gc:universal NODE_329_length_10886_cov_0.296653:6920-5604(-)
MIEFGIRPLSWATLHSNYKEIQNKQVLFDKQPLKSDKLKTEHESLIVKEIDMKFPFITRGIFRWYYWPTCHGHDLLDLSIHPVLPLISISRPHQTLSFDIQAQRFTDPYICPQIGKVCKSLWRPCDGYSLSSIGEFGIALFKKGVEYKHNSPDEHFQAISKVVPWYRILPLPIKGKITSATWSNDGRYLAMGVYGCSNVFILDVNLQSYSILSYRGSAPCQLKYSPDDYLLAVGDFSGSLILIDTNTFDQKTWSGFQTSITSLEWYTNSNFLFFTTKHSSDLQILRRIHKSLKSCELMAPLELAAIKIEPLSVHVGGAIRQCKIDPNGQFIAVSFEPEDDEENEDELDIVQLPSVDRRLSTPLFDFSTPRKTPVSMSKYPGRGTPRKTGNFATPQSQTQQYRTPTKSVQREQSAKEGRTKIAIFNIDHKNGKLFTSVL